MRTCLSLGWDEAAGTARVDIVQEGPDGVVPAEREIVLHLLSADVEGATVDGRPVEVREREADGFTLGAGVDVHLGTVRPGEGVSVALTGVSVRTPGVAQEAFRLIEAAQIDYLVKDRAWVAVRAGATGTALLSALRAAGIPEDVIAAVSEAAKIGRASCRERV